MSFKSYADQDSLSAGTQVIVHFAQTCPSGAHSDYSEFSQAFAALSSVGSVAGVSGDTGATLSNLFSIFTNYYVATINPIDGVQAGALRADIMTALSSLAQGKVIPCSGFTVDAIGYDDGRGILANVTGSGPSLTTTTVVVAVAVIAVVFFLVTKEIT